MTNKLDNKAAFDNDAAFNQKVFVNMDLIPCPVCGHLCSRDALTCPKCGKPLAKKNKVIAAILALLFGGLGLHKFYLGKILWGVIYLLFCWTGIPCLNPYHPLPFIKRSCAHLEPNLASSDE